MVMLYIKKKLKFFNNDIVNQINNIFNIMV